MIIRSWKEFYVFLRNHRELALDFLERIERLLFHRVNGNIVYITTKYMDPPIKVFSSDEDRIFFSFYALNPEIIYRPGGTVPTVYIFIPDYFHYVVEYITGDMSDTSPIYSKNFLNIHPVFYKLMKNSKEGRLFLKYDNFSTTLGISKNQKYVDKILKHP